MAKEYSPYKMKGYTLPGIQQSPAKKELIGNQNNLPAGLKEKIKAAPGKMYEKSPAKIAPLIAAVAPAVIGAMTKKKE